jgi:competence protein CoiA
MLTARAPLLDYVEAGSARRGEAYVCRGCGAPVIFKPGTIRVPHFAHRPDTGCGFGARMSPAHLAAQNLIAAALRARGLMVELEAPLTDAAGDRRIDVLAWPPDRPAARVAIEVQASDMTAEALEARTRSYQRLGVDPLWLRLIDFAAFKAVQTLPFRGTIWIERYPARAWERWAHDRLGGRLWFMDAGTGLVWRGGFVSAHRFRERAAGRGDAGEVMGRGADWTEARRWVDLELDGPYAAADLKLARGGAPLRFAWFAPPGEDGARPPFAPGVRVAFQPESRGSSRTLQVLVDSHWVTGTTEGARSDWRTRRPERRPVLRPPPG